MSNRHPGHAGVDRFDVDVVPLEATHERRGRVSGIERKHANVTSPDQTVADHIGVADRHDDRLVGKHSGELGSRAIAADLVGEFPHRLERLGRRRHVRAQPPQRTRERMPLDDPTAGNDQSGRVEVQRSQRVRRLLDQRRRIRALGPRDVAEMLDRMHDATVPRLRATLSCGGRHPATSPGPERCDAQRGRSGYPDRGRQSLRSLAVADTTPDTAAPAPSRLGEKLPADLALTPLVDGVAGTGRPIMEWLTTFHLASVVLDPYTNESSWVLKSAARVLEQFRGSDARINLIVTANAADAERVPRPVRRSLPRLLRS